MIVYDDFSAISWSCLASLSQLPPLSLGRKQALYGKHRSSEELSEFEKFRFVKPLCSTTQDSLDHRSLVDDCATLGNTNNDLSR